MFGFSTSDLIAMLILSLKVLHFSSICFQFGINYFSYTMTDPVFSVGLFQTSQNNSEDFVGHSLNQTNTSTL